ncbi:MAG: hypothetical protein GX840_05430 [Bacteroidales bacterium]|jgi:hypothetical protein|nr:hypothetical protein [Bacteroidales bacterium]
MKFHPYFLAISGLLIWSCVEKDHIQLPNSITQVELEDISSDIQLISVKSSQPMKDVLFYYNFGEYDFILSSDYRTIYCLEDDSIISVLERVGRGRGEYQGISTFAYSVEDSLMYVVDYNNKLYIYKGFDYEYIGIVDNLPQILSMRVVGKSHLLAACVIQDNEIEEQYGFVIIDTKTGTISERLLSMSYIGMFSNKHTSYYQYNDSIYFSVGDNYLNRIYLYSNGEFTTQLEFTYSKKLRLPKRAIVDDPDDLSELLIFNNYVLGANRYCFGADYPILSSDGHRCLFWSFPEGGDNIMTSILNNKITRYHITIPGITGFVAPHYVSSDYYVMPCQDMKRNNRADSKHISVLSEQIFEQIDKNEGNPVLLKFKIK